MSSYFKYVHIWLFVILCTLGLASTPTSFAQQSLMVARASGQAAASKASHGMNFYSREAEHELGQRLTEELIKEARVAEDPQLRLYVNDLVQRIARESDVTVPLVVTVLESDEINAFGLPGGFLFVNTGLLAKVEDESQLAAVLAHEIAHVTARDATRQMSKQELLSAVQIPLAFFGGPLALTLETGAQLAAPMTMLRFSRNAERNADRLGLQYAYQAGYDPASFATLFQSLGKSEGKHSRVAKLFQTHPSFEERTRSFEALVAQTPPGGEYIQDTSAFQEMKAALQAEGRSFGAVPHMVKRAEKSTSSFDSSRSGESRSTGRDTTFHDMRSDFESLLNR